MTGRDEMHFLLSDVKDVAGAALPRFLSAWAGSAGLAASAALSEACTAPRG